MGKELPLSLEDGDMRKLSVCTDPSNEDSTHVKQKSAFWIIQKLYRGSTRKDLNCPGSKWEQHYNRTKPLQFYLNLRRWGSATYLRFKINLIASQKCCSLNFSNGSCCYLFWFKIVSIQAEALHLLQNVENPQAHHKAVCWIGLQSQLKDGTDATPVWKKNNNRMNPN